MIPQAKVWAINSDGALCMNLGTLLTEAHARPKNLIHFVLSNRCYQALDGQDLVNTERTDYAAMARAAGCERTFTFHDLDQWQTGVHEVIASDRYTFVALEVEKEINPPKLQVEYEGPEVKYRFGRYVEQRFGVRIFGPGGY